VIDHVILNVSDYERSRAFYTKALEPLGYSPGMERPAPRIGAFVEQPEGGPPRFSFWIASEREPTSVLHVAFAAPDRETVDAFHAAALEAGGQDNGGPGVREIYHPDYYGAFVLDPDGNNVEAVCHRPAG
jgi:catechol 2,3-dioxygenase-like lactoylglutathione lyase family enzyme